MGSDLITLGSNSENKTEIYALGKDQNLWTIWQKFDGGWSAWKSHLGKPQCGIDNLLAVGKNSDNKLEIYALGKDQNLWTIWQYSAPQTGWSPWSSHLGRPPCGIDNLLAVGKNSEKKIEIYALGKDQNLWTIWQYPAPRTGWSPWSPHLGKPPAGIDKLLSVESDSNNKIEIFVLGKDQNLWTIWQYPAPQTGWSSWNSLGKPPCGIDNLLAVGKNSDNKLEIYALGKDQNLWTIWQKSDGGWSSWSSHLESPPCGIDNLLGVGKNSENKIEIYALGKDQNLWTIWQYPAPRTGWSPWSPHLGKPPAEITSKLLVGKNSDNKVEIYTLGKDQNLWTIWQYPAPQTGWSSWNSLGKP